MDVDLEMFTSVVAWSSIKLFLVLLMNLDWMTVDWENEFISIIPT